MPTVIEITREYLKANGYDGLVRSDYECGCNIEDLMPCGECEGGCEAGYQETADPETGYDFVIKPGLRHPQGLLHETLSPLRRHS